MKHLIAHDLELDTARKVTDHAFAEYKAKYAQYNPDLRWSNERQADIGFHAMGMTVKGSIDVNEKQIAVDLDVPFLLRPFRTKALEVIEREVNRWIAKVKAGEVV